jgi:hypothetical protein
LSSKEKSSRIQQERRYGRQQEVLYHQMAPPATKVEASSRQESAGTDDKPVTKSLGDKPAVLREFKVHTDDDSPKEQENRPENQIDLERAEPH